MHPNPIPMVSPLDTKPPHETFPKPLRYFVKLKTFEEASKYPYRNRRGPVSIVSNPWAYIKPWKTHTKNPHGF